MMMRLRILPFKNEDNQSKQNEAGIQYHIKFLINKLQMTEVPEGHWS